MLLIQINIIVLQYLISFWKRANLGENAMKTPVNRITLTIVTPQKYTFLANKLVNAWEILFFWLEILKKIIIFGCTVPN